MNTSFCCIGIRCSLLDSPFNYHLSTAIYNLSIIRRFGRYRLLNSLYIQTLITELSVRKTKCDTTLSVKVSAAVVRIDLDTQIGYRYSDIQR